MREIIMDGIQRHIHPLAGLEKARLMEISPGHAKLSIEITKDMLNLYGNLHGGFIFSLCDMAAGMATYAYEITNVTLQGNINYVKAVNAGTIYVEANAIHKGGTTVINQVEIKNEAGSFIASASFSMFLLSPIP